jgi:hypothetical protein
MRKCSWRAVGYIKGAFNIEYLGYIYLDVCGDANNIRKWIP